MKNKQAKPIPAIIEYTDQWKLHQQLGKFAAYLDRPKDAAAIRKQKLKAAPVSLADMVF